MALTLGKFFTVFVISAVFAMFLFTFVTTVQIANNVNNSLMDDESMAGFNNTLGSQLNDWRTVSESQYNATSTESSGSASTFYFVLQSIFNSLKNMFGFIINLLLGSMDLIETWFGIPKFITGSLYGLIIILGVFAWYRLIKVGDG